MRICHTVKNSEKTIFKRVSLPLVFEITCLGMDLQEIKKSESPQNGQMWSKNVHNFENSNDYCNVVKLSVMLHILLSSVINIQDEGSICDFM